MTTIRLTDTERHRIEDLDERTNALRKLTPEHRALVIPFPAHTAIITNDSTIRIDATSILRAHHPTSEAETVRRPEQAA